MKAIERLGAFVLETWVAWLVVFGVSFWVIYVFTGPKTVTLDSKNWRCTMAVPNGLETKCMEYVSKEVIK
jgi:hypothetical protein